MVLLNKIYTRTGDEGQTRLANGALVSKTDLRVEAYGAVDELNAVIGLARLNSGQNDRIDAMLARIRRPSSARVAMSATSYDIDREAQYQTKTSWTARCTSRSSGKSQIRTSNTWASVR